MTPHTGGDNTAVEKEPILTPQASVGVLKYLPFLAAFIARGFLLLYLCGGLRMVLVVDKEGNPSNNEAYPGHRDNVGDPD